MLSYGTNMHFEVNSDAIISGIINGEIQARMACRAKSSQNPKKYKLNLQKYKDAGIVNSTPSVVKFMRKYPKVFKNPKLVSYRNGNIFEEMITLAPLSSNEDYNEKLKNRMVIGHDLTEKEMEGMDAFLDDFHALSHAEDLKTIIDKTKTYSRSVERLWRSREREILKHVESVLGYKPENVGKVNTYIMYPNYDTHRSCQLSGNRTFMFLGKRGRGQENKILAYLSHQAVHQPMLPYKMYMSKADKEKFHCFVKFLTDKDVYTELSGESYLDIATPKENYALMGKIYPFWLGYRYRNARKKGLDPTKEIEKAIQRDKQYYDALPENSRMKALCKAYDFEHLDAHKIADFFRYKKGISPYDFIKIDFDNRSAVCREVNKTAREEAVK